MWATGRARSCTFFLLGPESMHPRRFQILSWLLISWQLLVPSGAPWLHTLIDGGCSAETCETGRSEGIGDQHSHVHSACRHAHHSATGPHSHSHGSSDPAKNKTHDCSNCAVCQAIAAPRIVCHFVVLPVTIDRIEILSIAHCADPLLGFGLPPQCRAPPAV
jgi:hypothetical protein